MLVFAAGLAVGRWAFETPAAHAQERSIEYSTCRVVVPKTWGEFRGASTYGLAFQDESGTIRFLLHPPCGSLDAPTATSAIDLMVQRK